MEEEKEKEEEEVKDLNGGRGNRSITLLVES